tara:strand:- start:2748 stop:3773 length:1026 start_codon:yes stop_codon:yes gene_type:complete
MAYNFMMTQKNNFGSTANDLFGVDEATSAAINAANGVSEEAQSVYGEALQTFNDTKTALGIDSTKDFTEVGGEIGLTVANFAITQLTGTSLYGWGAKGVQAIKGAFADQPSSGVADLDTSIDAGAQAGEESIELTALPTTAISAPVSTVATPLTTAPEATGGADAIVGTANVGDAGIMPVTTATSEVAADTGAGSSLGSSAGASSEELYGSAFGGDLDTAVAPSLTGTADVTATTATETASATDLSGLMPSLEAGGEAAVDLGGVATVEAGLAPAEVALNAEPGIGTAIAIGVAAVGALVGGIMDILGESKDRPAAPPPLMDVAGGSTNTGGLAQSFQAGI